ncbi:hypothetical protein OHT76_42300 [Streptomyces sp. NBC_00287]|uniref:hypothetical protein n=1 Tax=Streptomyces sp. NBC_00287 TaxID=2975702 RepID=UPI002E2BBD95|nr:hypothetical protein [Streptomyces sp. NBC_00287]
MTDPAPVPSGDPHSYDERLWQHVLHLENSLLQRGNLFLLAQSLQVVGYATMLSASTGSSHGADRALTATRVLAAFGIVLTLAWLYAMYRHYTYARNMVRQLGRRVPDYLAIRVLSRGRGPSHMPLVVYGLPTLSGVMWVILLALS